MFPMPPSIDRKKGARFLKIVKVNDLVRVAAATTK